MGVVVLASGGWVVTVSGYLVSEDNGVIKLLRRHEACVECVAKPSKHETDDVSQFDISMIAPKRIPHRLAPYQ